MNVQELIDKLEKVQIKEDDLKYLEEPEQIALEEILEKISRGRVSDEKESDNNSEKESKEEKKEEPLTVDDKKRFLLVGLNVMTIIFFIIVFTRHIIWLLG